MHKTNAHFKHFNFHFNLDILVLNSTKTRNCAQNEMNIKIKIEQKSLVAERFHEIPICYGVAVWEMLSYSMFYVQCSMFNVSCLMRWTAFLSISRHAIMSRCSLFLFMFNIPLQFTVHSLQTFSIRKCPSTKRFYV